MYVCLSVSYMRQMDDAAFEVINNQVFTLV